MVGLGVLIWHLPLPYQAHHRRKGGFRLIISRRGKGVAGGPKGPKCVFPLCHPTNEKLEVGVPTFFFPHAYEDLFFPHPHISSSNQFRRLFVIACLSVLFDEWVAGIGAEMDWLMEGQDWMNNCC